MSWNPVEEFFKTQHGKGLMKTASTKKEALDKDSYYEKDKLGPTQDEIKNAHPGGGEDTQVSSGGGGGEGLYEVKKTNLKGDAHVETVTERAEVMEDVARRDSKGVQGKSDIKGLAKEGKSDNKSKMKKLRDKKKSMKKKCQLESLIKLADKLDGLGLADEANMIDTIIREESVPVEAEEASEASTQA